MFELKNLTIKIEDKIMTDKLNLQIEKSETHFIMGKNGVGKTSLLMGIFGHPNFNIESGKIILDKKNVTSKATNEKAALGMFLSFQHPTGIEGLSVSNLLKHSVNSCLRANGKKPLNAPAFFGKLNKAIEVVGVSKNWLSKDINLNFSGGEKKRLEMLQMIMLEPKIAFLDEPDSGVDINSVKVIADTIEYMKKEFGTSFLIITHYHKLFDLVKTDKVHIFENQTIIKSGNKDIAKEILEKGFQ